jgi:hypothetical protein
MAHLKRRKSTQAPLAVMAVVGVLIGVLIGGGAFSSAASTSPSVANYQQCSDNPGAKNACGGGWINGILNAGGSQYAENDATAQRLVIDLPAGAPGGAGDQSFSLKYLWNKSSNHAYDSLVKWNTTISGLTTAAQVCSGVSGTCPANSGNFNSGDGVDASPVAFQTSSCTGTKSGFGIASRDLVVYGPAGTDVTSITQPVNDSSSCSITADEYETLTVHFTVPSLPARVMFLFAGHLACGTNRTGCWGTTGQDVNGSSAINGGPYHIKLLTIDGTTAGNQDNQIMSSAIAPLTLAGVSTTPDASPTSSVTWTETLTDSATVTGSSPSGTVTFKLYAGGTCTNGVPDGSLIYTSPAETVNSGSAATGTTDGYTVGNDGQAHADGTYQWIAEYSGDSNNSPASSTCGGEVQTVTAATTSGPSVS